MGNPKLRFSEFISNAWFHKPKNLHQITTTTKGELPLSLSPPRKSYHFTRSLEIPEQKSPRRRIRRKQASLGASNPSHELRPIKTEREAIDDHMEKEKSCVKSRGRRANGSFSENGSSVASDVRSVRRSQNGSPRIRIRIHSPRLTRRAQVNSSKVSMSSSPSKKGVSSKSLAVVKTSSDPQRDFKESMVEMIVENNIRASKDLEELLACYLSLNTDNYHDVIIEAFTQIWFDLKNIMKQSKK